MARMVGQNGRLIQVSAPKQNPASATTPVIAAIIALIFWSGTSIANKYAVDYIDAITAGALRSMLAGGVALIVAFTFRLKRPDSIHEWILLVVSGVTSFALWPMVLSLGIANTTASHAALIMATLPITTVLILSIVSRSIPRPGWWLGAIIAVSGAAWLVIGRGGSLAVSNLGSTITGDLIIFSGCIVCSIGYVAGGKLSPTLGTVQTTFWGLSVAMLVLAPVMFLRMDLTDWAMVPPGAWAGIGWMALFSSLIGYGLWFYALGHGGIARIGTLQLLMPVLALAAANAILDEPITTQLIATSVLILLGTYIAHRYSRPGNKRMPAELEQDSGTQQ